MLENFKQQQEMSVLELYIEKDVAGGSMFHSANSLTSCGNYVSNDYTQPPTNMSNLNLDEDDDHDDDDYLVSNSYVEESLDEDDSVDGISDTDNEVPEMIPPCRHHDGRFTLPATCTTTATQRSCTTRLRLTTLQRQPASQTSGFQNMHRLASMGGEFRLLWIRQWYWRFPCHVGDAQQTRHCQ
ncbi:hypothetical protein GmHk_07G019577 [Glycine max]|nr:hypothetical protein GmHk_07G019577 [Glycine max]